MRDLCTIMRPVDAWAWLLSLAVSAPALLYCAKLTGAWLGHRVLAWLTPRPSYWQEDALQHATPLTPHALEQAADGWKQSLNVPPDYTPNFTGLIVGKASREELEKRHPPKGEGDRPAGEEQGRERQDG